MKGITRVYPADHWLRSDDPERLIEQSARQQALAYSRVKNDLLWEIIGRCEGKRFLDLGCGSGFFLVEALKRGADLAVGVDTLESCLAGAKKWADRENAGEKVLLIPAGNWAEIANQSPFDIILMRDVIEHVEDDLELVRRIAGLLARQGVLVLSTQNAWSLNFLMEGAIQRIILRKKTWCGWDPTHLRFYTPRRLNALFNRAGLKAGAWRSSYLIPHKIPFPFGRNRQYLRLEWLTLADRILGRLLPFNRLGWCLMVRVTK